MPGIQHRHPASVRQRLLEAALICFIRQGIKGSTTKAIAREAQVSEMTLFRTFETKQALIDAVFEPVITAHRELRHTTDLRQHLMERLRFVREHQQVLRILFDAATQPEIRLMEILMEEARIQIQQADLAIDPDVALRVISGTMLSALVFMHDEAADRQLVEALMAWLTPREEK
jgi:AcrR family transcriptional regulator